MSKITLWNKLQRVALAGAIFFAKPVSAQEILEIKPKSFQEKLELVSDYVQEHGTYGHSPENYLAYNSYYLNLASVLEGDFNKSCFIEVVDNRARKLIVVRDKTTRPDGCEPEWTFFDNGINGLGNTDFLEKFEKTNSSNYASHYAIDKNQIFEYFSSGSFDKNSSVIDLHNLIFESKLAGFNYYTSLFNGMFDQTLDYILERISSH